jgi:hypothetical protein
MARLILFLLAVNCHAFAFSVVEEKPHEYSSKRLYGPEAFEFCGGWVELWIQDGDYLPQFILKATPPAGEWGISNGNIIIEDPNIKEQPIRFSDFESFKTKAGEINTHIWTFPRIKNEKNEFKVALLPFAGCTPDQKTRGVVLKEYKFE